MKDLIERLEKATGPDKELDAYIWAARYAPHGHVRQSRFNGAWCVYQDSEGERLAEVRRAPRQSPDYTASLDAAMTLMKAGDYDFSLARTTRGGPEFTEWQARVALDTVEDDPDETGPQALGEGHTAPLACCAAFLKVHSRSVEEPKE